MAQRSNPYIIDVHQHCFPPEYTAVLDDIGWPHASNPTMPWPSWSPETHLAGMDEYGITTGILSITGGLVYSRTLTRKCNEYFARIISDHPGRFGACAVLPFPDMEGTLKEVEYSIDTLKLDGVGLITNVQGHYLGDPEYVELFEELNRRKMVVCIHPNNPPYVSLGKVHGPGAMMEFPLETTRTVGQMLYGGTLDHCPDVRFILPHAGGAIPFVAGRYAGYGQKRDIIAILKKQYYDTSGSAYPYPLRALQELVEPSQILFGSDYGMGGTRALAEQIEGLHAYKGFDEKTLMMVERDNALKLFPRFKKG
jgi:predicted TIM-barrel fold metal-dependent hydrolase